METYIRHIGPNQTFVGNVSICKIGQGSWNTSKGKHYYLSGNRLYCTDGRSWFPVNSESEAETIIYGDCA